MSLMNNEEAAEYLRVPLGTLRYWRHRNEGPPSVRIGRRVFYREQDLIHWVDAKFEEAEKRVTT